MPLDERVEHSNRLKVECFFELLSMNSTDFGFGTRFICNVTERYADSEDISLQGLCNAIFIKIKNSEKSLCFQ